MTIDYKKTMQLLEVFNTALRQSGAERDFYYEGKNLLASFQMSLFSDIKTYTYNKNTNRPKSIFQEFKAYLVQCGLLILSFASYCYLWIRKGVRKRPVVAVYSIDTMSDPVHMRDARVSHIYQALKDQKESMLEFMHTVPTWKTVRNFFSRLNPVIYMESVHFIANHIQWLIRYRYNRNVTYKIFNMDNECSAEDAVFLYELFRKYEAKARAFAMVEKVYEYIYRCFTIKRFWSIDDSRYTPELLHCLNKQNITSYLFQHGHYTKYHVGFLSGAFNPDEIIKSTYIVVWNSYFKNELLRLGSYFIENQILIGGEKKGVKTYQSKILSSSITTVLIPYETDAPKAEVRAYIDHLVKNGKTVYLKLRRDMPQNLQLEQYGYDVHHMPNACIPIVDDSEIINIVDMVAGVYSTYLYDMLYLGVPVAILDTSMDYGVGMVLGGLAVMYREGMTDAEVFEKYAQIIPRIQALYGDISYVGASMKKCM